MYAQSAFRIDRAASLAFAQARGFGLLIAAGSDGPPVASSLPFHLSYAADGGAHLAFHVARGNPLAALAASGGHWLLAVNGSDAYISPDWYASAEQVPTWLYLAVHMTGPVRLLSDSELTRHLDELSAIFEARLAPKPAWTSAKLAPARRKMMAKAIVGITMEVETVEGSFKLNQHKSDADHAAVVHALAAQPDAAAQAIATQMVAMRPHLTYEPADAAA